MTKQQQFVTKQQSSSIFGDGGRSNNAEAVQYDDLFGSDDGREEGECLEEGEIRLTA